MKKNIVKLLFSYGFIFLPSFFLAQSIAPDEDTGSYTTCNPEGANVTRTSSDLPNPVNVGTIDDRSCYANYKESTINGTVWGNYNITYNSNNQDAANTLQPRIERSLSRSKTTGLGSYARFTGTVRILEVGDTSGTGNDGTYIMQAKGKHTGEGGPPDPAICLFLAKPVLDSNNHQVAFDIYREQINYRGGSGANGRDIVLLTRINKNVETNIELEVGFRQDPNDVSKKIHYADAVIGGVPYNFNIPEPERGTESGIRYGVYRVKGGRAQIRWANTTYQKVENEDVTPEEPSVTSITTAQSGNWNTGTTWVGGVVPTSSNDVIILDDTQVTVTDIQTSNSIKVGTGSASLTINSGGALSVTGDIYLRRFDNGLVVQNTNSANAMGTLIIGGNVLTLDTDNTTTTTADKRLLVRKILTNNNWYLVSQVGSKQPRLNDRMLTSNFRENAGKRSIAVYNNTNVPSAKYEYFATGTLANSVELELGKGASVSVNGTGNSNTTGKFENKAFYSHGSSIELAISADATTGDAFNLIGNPFLSNLYGNSDANATNVLSQNTAVLEEASLWFWNGDTGSWVTKNHSSVAFTIPPVTGFFVKSSSGGGNFTFTKTMETHTATGNIFSKNASQRFEINLSIANGKSKTETAIRFIDGMTTSFDNGYDSSLFDGYTNELEVFTNIVDTNIDKKLAIQSLPNSNFEDLIIPVGVIATINSEITFTTEVLNIPSGYNMYLEDRLKNIFINLNDADAEYQATILESTTEGRFYIHVKASVLAVSSELLSSVKIIKSDATLKIVGLPQGITKVHLYNILGKQLLKSSFSENRVQEIVLPKLTKGVYIVQLATEKGSIRKKIILE